MNYRFNSIGNIFPVLLVLAAIVGGCGDAAPSTWKNAKPVAETRFDHPSALTADAGQLYFVTGGTIASRDQKSNNLVRLPFSGAAAETVFAGNELIPDTHSLKSDASHLYFSAGGIRSVPKAGGQSRILAAAAPAAEIAVDEESVYWIPFVGEGMPAASIYRVPKNGGEAIRLTGERHGAEGLVVSDGYLYWSERAGIYRISASGGSVEQIVTASNGSMFGGFQMDEKSYFYLEGSSAKALMRRSRDGGDPVELAKNVSRFWLAGEKIILQRFIASFDAAIFVVHAGGGPERELDRGGHLAELTVVGNEIYLSDVSRIYRLPIN